MIGLATVFVNLLITINFVSCLNSASLTQIITNLNPPKWNSVLRMSSPYKSQYQEALLRKQTQITPTQSVQARSNVQAPQNHSVQEQNLPFTAQSTSTAAPGNKQAWVPAPEPRTARERASFKNKIPFSESMYEVLKTSIQLLTERMKSKAPLTIDEANWLSQAVETIIEDANMYGPPARRPVSNNEQ